MLANKSMGEHFEDKYAFNKQMIIVFYCFICAIILLYLIRKLYLLYVKIMYCTCKINEVYSLLEKFLFVKLFPTSFKIP